MNARGRDGTVEADPDSQRQNGVSGFRDLLGGRGAADHLVQATPWLLPPAHWHITLLGFLHGISHCLLCYLLTCLSSVARTLAPSLSCSMTAPLRHDLPPCSPLYPSPGTAGGTWWALCSSSLSDEWMNPCSFWRPRFCSQGLVFCLSYECPLNFRCTFSERPPGDSNNFKVFLLFLSVFLSVFLFSSLSTCCELHTVPDTRNADTTRVHGPNEIADGGVKRDLEARGMWGLLPRALSPICLDLGPGSYVFYNCLGGWLNVSTVYTAASSVVISSSGCSIQTWLVEVLTAKMLKLF